MEYRAVEAEPPIDGCLTLEDIFRDIERTARSSGRTDFMLMLDRVPGLVIGHENSRDNAEIEAHLVRSLEILKGVQVEVEQSQGRGPENQNN